MLTALRAEFETEHADRPEQAAGWTEGTVLAVVRHQMLVIAGPGPHEPGDLILAQRDPCRETVATLPPVDSAWLPRTYAFARLIHGDADDVISGQM